MDSHNWYAALTLALSLPDICGRLEDPSAKSQARFTKWFDRYLLSRYQAGLGHNRTLHTYLSGNDCYALRCAYLHQGEFGIEDQRAREAITHFQFIAPRPGLIVHMNQSTAAGTSVLQLQVNVFCTDVCVGVEQWLDDVAKNEDVQRRINNLAVIA
jgi:hypothetical protein